MAEKAASPRLTCPQCGETVLPEDKFCFHCGRRLKVRQTPSVQESKPRHFPQWPLALVGILALVLAGYVVHHESSTLARLPKRVASPNPISVPKRAPHAKVPPSLHPVVTTTTTYPGSMPSSASWTPEVESYQNVQFEVRLPAAMHNALGASAGSWSWGTTNGLDRVTLSVVSAKPSSATVNLGPNTYGTSITQTASTASQNLFVTWAPHKWLEVSMTVPKGHVNWLGGIATSVRIS
ncbi:MAG: zinc ribbon domain-containing protein [Sulfobacillus acidophilus]|uniref:Zinc ribbon domain-containing protein n=1 Tax=Sulfobacillus acidophilus TaxID=53633 RepID=A0A2T2WGR8_9FIRM|nr:MAG: zinc ribbon domain-containing protein [Sulfobacillus acidophilus]